MDDLIAKVQTIYHSFAAGNPNRDLLSDLHWHEMAGGPYGGVYLGFEQITTHVFAHFATDWAQFDFEPEQFLCDGNCVVVIGNYTIRRKHETTPTLVRVTHVWSFEHSRPVRWEQFADTALLQLSH